MNIHKRESDLIDYSRGIIERSEYYRAIDIDVILDGRLSSNSVLIYLAILSQSDTRGFPTKIPASHIESISGVAISNHHRSIKQLDDLGYIGYEKLKYENRYRVYRGSKIILIPDVFFKTIVKRRRHIVRTLTGLALSFGNNQIPTYQRSKERLGGKLSYKRWRELRDIYDISDESIISLDVLNYNILLGYSDEKAIGFASAYDDKNYSACMLAYEDYYSNFAEIQEQNKDE